MPNALITGGAGFIGSHLCGFLMEKGFNVICMDNLVTGQKENIQSLICSGKFKFINHDASRPIEIEEPLDWVLHFASPASPIDYQKIPIQTLKAGSLGTHNTLGLALAKKAKYFLASTSEVYGDPLVNPQPESYWGNVNCIGVRGCYDESKRFAEALTMAYHRIHNLDIRIVRIFNSYGPKMRKKDGRAVPNFITQTLEGKNITVYGNGSQTRSFCYISDLIEGIYRLLTSNATEPVNLGSQEEVSILDFAREIVELTGSKSRIVFNPLPIDDPKVRQPDITRAKKLLSWEPRVKRRDGIIKTLEYFRKKVAETAKEEKCSFVRVRPQTIENEQNFRLFSKLGFVRAPMHLHAELTHQLDLNKSEDENRSRNKAGYEVRD
ncbi:MAG: NAD-dependent epimerase/dehydratase [Candidatus Amesbacteria bacterium GW2011_GWC2_47_8]|uniref:UDP-glucuronate decarboxylase n=1 Tax=Candidatus Amesbacteria bacterium GW2011_GWC2_47_8 TaxID=1618367 RepID=A0A0G1TLK2_9BACT|nr:MAG: NAD-dependent epimerase/dehydratase [Candidatus Amesbacteria bacterium GW2011_GWC2_47_8]